VADVREIRIAYLQNGQVVSTGQRDRSRISTCSLPGFSLVRYARIKIYPERCAAAA
jgi:hypothetical protein